MRYLKRFAMVFSLVFVLFGAMAIDASAQRRVIVRRPVIIHPYYGYGWGWGFHNYGYYDPYIAAQQEENARRSSVKHDEKVLRKHEDEYYADGVITEKERKKLADDKKDLSNSERDLHHFYRYY